MRPLARRSLRRRSSTHQLRRWQADATSTDVVDVDVFQATARLGTEFDRRRVGTDDIVRDDHIRAGTFRRALQRDTIVVTVNPAVGDSHSVATVEIPSVLVPAGSLREMSRALNVRIDSTVDGHSVNENIGALAVVSHPGRRVSQDRVVAEPAIPMVPWTTRQVPA